MSLLRCGNYLLHIGTQKFNAVNDGIVTRNGSCQSVFVRHISGCHRDPFLLGQLLRVTGDRRHLVAAAYKFCCRSEAKEDSWIMIARRSACIHAWMSLSTKSGCSRNSRKAAGLEEPRNPNCGTCRRSFGTVQCQNEPKEDPFSGISQSSNPSHGFRAHSHSMGI